MTLTEAPNDLAGRFLRNWALTIPEFPRRCKQTGDFLLQMTRTMWPGDLPPDHANFRTSDLPLAPVYECDFLSEVETNSSVRRSCGISAVARSLT